MYSGSAPLILYSLPKIVTLSVSGSVAIAIPSDRYVLATVLGREASRTTGKTRRVPPFRAPTVSPASLPHAAPSRGAHRAASSSPARALEAAASNPTTSPFQPSFPGPGPDPSARGSGVPGRASPRGNGPGASRRL